MTNQSVARQSATAPIAVPSGAPSTSDEVIPSITMAMARPRWASPARVAAAALAVAVNSAAPAAASTREASTKP
ncbi:MAG TPA: hypothetical protein VK735_26475 [Pseudonocardia sp.]|nr:hypothetical protein [Pseudonocardia sp.]HTF51005.1 hypothetical protein [Pseudonocardia sp.]